MFIFIGSSKVIPDSRLVCISTQYNLIHIEYDTGELTYLDSESAQAVPKVIASTVRYNDEESALWEMRKFYIACEKKAGVFCFSPDKGVELREG